MIQINLIRDRKVEKVAGSRPAGGGLKLSLPHLPFNVGVLAGVLGVLAVLIIIALTMISQKAQISSLDSKIKNYNEELVKLAGPKRLVDDYLKKQADVNIKLNEIISIDKNRFYTIKLLDALSNSLPDYLWVTVFKEDKGNVNIEGLTFSNLIVADFMDKLKGTGYFSDVELNQTAKTDQDGRELVKFVISSKYIDSPIKNEAGVNADTVTTAGKGSK